MTTTATPKLGRATITGIDIACYLTSDPERSMAFYRDVLGMTPTEIDEQARGAEFSLPDGSTFGVWNTGQQPSGGVMMFAVEDAHAAVGEFRQRGAELSDVSETEVCYMSFGKDPDGNGFIIHQRKKA